MKWKRCTPWTVPATPGVYKIFLDGNLVYVGMSVALKQRFSTHYFMPGGKKEFKGMQYETAEVRYVVVRCEDGRRIIERRLIARHSPILNKPPSGVTRMVARINKFIGDEA